MSILKDLSNNIINLPRYTKRVIAILIDIGLCIFCTWLAFYLRLEEFVKINDVTTLAVEISILIAIPIFWLMGLYKTIHQNRLGHSQSWRFKKQKKYQYYD